MHKYLKIGLFGFLTWLIPFVVAFFFYSKDGQPLIDIFLFKSIMIVVSAIVGVSLLVLYFKKIKRNYVKEGVIVGLAWLAINLILDFVVLIPMSGMPLQTYFGQIGLRYLIIPVISTGMGYVAEHK